MLEELDWNKMWMDAMENSTWWKSGGNDEWGEESARRFYEWIKQPDNTERYTGNVAKLDIDSDSTVLDIGSGPGSYTIPLAKTVKHVTALDPSKAMLVYLKKIAEEEKLSNIDCVNKKWEDVVPFEDVREHDILIASHSFAMLDMKAALEKMNQLARRAVYLFTGAGCRRSQDEELWLKLHDEEQKHEPGYIYIYNILFEMGIYANVMISDVEYRQKYSNFEEALERWKKSFEADTKESEEIIRSYISDLLIEKDGVLWFIEDRKEVMIWWNQLVCG